MNAPVADQGYKIAPVYLTFEGELMLDTSAKHAWPLVIDYPSWQNYSICQHISGEPGQEGEVVMLKKDEKAVTTPPYYARTVKLEPGRRIIWKVYPHTRTPEYDFFGFVEFKLEEANGGTRFQHRSLHEFMITHQHESELEAFRKQRTETTAALFATIFPKLKQLVERRA